MKPSALYVSPSGLTADKLRKVFQTPIFGWGLCFPRWLDAPTILGQCPVFAARAFRAVSMTVSPVCPRIVEVSAHRVALITAPRCRRRLDASALDDRFQVSKV